LKTRANAVSLFSAFALAAAVYGQQATMLAPPRPGYSFPRSRPHLCVDWRVFPAGTAVIHFEQAGDRERIAASADTIAPSICCSRGGPLPVDFDREKGCTYDFDKQTVEGRRQINSTERLDYANGKSILDEKNQVTGQTKHLEAKVGGCLTDLLTGVFYASSQPIALGHNFVLPVVDAMSTVLVTMKIEGSEEIKTPLGTFKTLRVQPPRMRAW